MMARKSKQAALLEATADWSNEDLEKLIAATRQQLIDRQSNRPPKTGEHIEFKMIPGRDGKRFGPYKYRRWWEDGKLKTQYLGKASQEEAAHYFEEHPEDRPNTNSNAA